MPGDLLLSQRFFEHQRLHGTPTFDRSSGDTARLRGLELCLELAREGDKVLVLTSGGHVGWTYGNMFNEVNRG